MTKFREWLVWYPYGRRFGSKIASANRKEGDGIGVSPVTEQVVKAHAIFEQNLLPYGYPNNSEI
jgi:hypothetical protein